MISLVSRHDNSLCYQTRVTTLFLAVSHGLLVSRVVVYITVESCRACHLGLCFYIFVQLFVFSSFCYFLNRGGFISDSFSSDSYSSFSLHLQQDCIPGL